MSIDNNTTFEKLRRLTYHRYMELRHQITLSLVVLGIVLPVAAFIYLSYLLIGTYALANIQVDANRPLGEIQPSWRAIAQGGEQTGVRMLQPVTNQLRSLFPKYIRIDHIYDFYDVVQKTDGGITYNWEQLDQTVCDIYATGAKPFFSLGYMPPSISSDGSLIAPPARWDQWRTLVQKTVERYSGQLTVLCGGTVKGDALANIYYEVWNEPDLESFGKWSIYGGPRNYLMLYEQSVRGAQNAQGVQQFYIGGPATTALYKNWMRSFLTYASDNNLRVDFLSWHRYTKDIDVFAKDAESMRDWLSAAEFEKYRTLPLIVSEWGYDPAYNPEADGPRGAAHLVAAVRHFIDQDIEYAFTFGARDGETPSLGILKHDGQKRSRYDALAMLNTLTGTRIAVEGESKHIKAIAVKKPNAIAVILANYDQEGKNGQQVPISFSGLEPGTYQLSVTNLGYAKLVVETLTLNGEDLPRSIYLSPNHVALVELTKQ